MNSTSNDQSGMSPADLGSLEGTIIDRSFQPGFVVLSFLVSYIGAWTTLELIHRRTSMKGTYNWFILTSSSLTMGGIAVWSMHFIGNRAIVLGNGDQAIQIIYNTGFTVASIFLPVIVVFLAFATVGSSNSSLSITRIILGGTLAGFGICGMHYLGQAGIWNYDCLYNSFYVVGAAVVAILASIGSLVIFFVYRRSWRTSWWKRAACALLLATAVSGMHWLASIGTSYRLRILYLAPSQTLSRSATVIVVLVLSIVACFILLSFMLVGQRRIRLLARRAQQVVLAVAVYDSEGRILVSSEGFLPARKITNAWLEQSLNDVFNLSHPVFLWMFRTSRNWLGIAPLLPAMKSHISQLGLKGIMGSRDENLISDEGIPISNYSLVFRELFCVAAADLAASLHQPIVKIGILYDEMISTGKGSHDSDTKSRMSGKSRRSAVTTNSGEELELEALSGLGKGQLLFLVSRVNRRDAESFQAAGYRFANVPQVISIMSNALQVRPGLLSRRIDVMKQYATERNMLDPGVHLAIFAIRASLGAGRHGFDVLARKDAKNQLPTMQLSPDPLEDWQWDFIRAMDTFPLAICMKSVHKATKQSNPSKKEQEFAKILLTALETLKTEIEDPFVNDALMIGRPIEAPCRGSSPESPPGVAHLVCFTIIVPIHGRAPGKKLMFEPLNFFNVQQHVYPHSPDHEAFTAKTFREYKSVLNLGPGGVAEGGSFSSIYNISPYNSGLSRNRTSRRDVSSDDIENAMIQAAPTKRRRVRFWDRARPSLGRDSTEILPTRRQDSPRKALLSPTVEAKSKEAENKTDPKADEKDQKTYVDELFTITIQKKGTVGR